ncbi:MAG: putative secreted protein [Marmoricola sp.]|nr:putative secreted protein [Marmoricola sp.]
MSRRSLASLIALSVGFVLLAVTLVRPTPYVTFLPGPTINVLGTFDGKKILDVSGHAVYPDTGGLRMVTVYPSGPDEKISFVVAMQRWIDPQTAVLPRAAVYQPASTAKSVQQQSAVEMTSSQDDATAAALNALGIRYGITVTVDDVTKGGASDGLLRKGDVVTAVDGHATTDATALINSIRAIKPGSKAVITIVRNSTTRKVSIVTRPATDDARSSRINVGIKESYRFPFTVAIRLSDSIGGPSAGMMFALSIYDLLTPGSLTGGKVVAGTGEISADGTVGAIGGIGQKIPAAQRDGAQLFLVPSENCAEALTADYDPNRMRLVKVHTLQNAIDAITAWRENPQADLPRCTG